MHWPVFTAKFNTREKQARKQNQVILQNDNARPQTVNIMKADIHELCSEVILHHLISAPYLINCKKSPEL